MIRLYLKHSLCIFINIWIEINQDNTNQHIFFVRLESE
jgi:hypothetical protein